MRKVVEIVALATSLALNIVLVWWRARPAPAPAVATPDPGPRLETPVRPAGRQETATIECESRRAALRTEVDRASAELRRVLSPKRLFALSPPNETARARLASTVAAILAGDAGLPPDYVFECRDFVCRLTVLDPLEGRSRKPWMPALQQSSELRRLVRRGFLFTGGGWLKDPATGGDLVRRHVYMSLLRADGAPDDEAAGAR